MGNDLVKCCTQTLITEEDDEENSDSNIALSDTAKSLHEMKETMVAKAQKYNHLNVPNTSAIKKKITKRLRSQRRGQRSMSVEQELDATEIELRQQMHVIKLLKKQNEYLRKQNEDFIKGYGSFFIANPATETSVNSILSPLSISSISETQSMDHLDTYSTKPSISDLTLSINTEQSTNNGPITPLSPISPLTVLTNEQTNIILSYSNISFPDTPNTRDNNI